jgi:two-component system, sporulation sensor kinase D
MADIYTLKTRWKVFLLICAIAIGAITQWYTNSFVQQLRDVERRKVKLWAEASRQMNNLDENTSNIGFIFEVIRDNNTVPVILTDEAGNINGYRNLDSLKSLEESYLRHQLEIMKGQHEPIVIDYYQGQKAYIFYKDSILLTKLQYYPLIMLLIITLFIGAAYYAFNSSRRSEQNRIWAGMARETAHQIGTPLSSLIGWLELLKAENHSGQTLQEMEKDLDRLSTITDRFSKIGSQPKLEVEDLVDVARSAMDYIEKRSSKSIHFSFSAPDYPIPIPLNRPLLEWVFENLIRNGIDALHGPGDITVQIQDSGNKAIIDVSDSGKGIRKGDVSKVFQPGFTTKKRGWGLGLSLAKRIVEQYHKGKIFVHHSERDKGTTFRMIFSLK